MQVDIFSVKHAFKIVKVLCYSFMIQKLIFRNQLFIINLTIKQLHFTSMCFITSQQIKMTNVMLFLFSHVCQVFLRILYDATKNKCQHTNIISKVYKSKYPQHSTFLFFQQTSHRSPCLPPTCSHRCSREIGTQSTPESRSTTCWVTMRESPVTLSGSEGIPLSNLITERGINYDVVET